MRHTSCRRPTPEPGQTSGDPLRHHGDNRPVSSRRVGRRGGGRRVAVTVQEVLVQQLGALPVIQEYMERLRLKERVDALAPVRSVAHLTNGEVVMALVANRLTHRGRCTTLSNGPSPG